MKAIYHRPSGFRDVPAYKEDVEIHGYVKGSVGFFAIVSDLNGMLHAIPIEHLQVKK